MLILNVQKKEKEEKAEKLRQSKILPAVVYGKDLKGLPIKVDYNFFDKVYKEAGESMIINLKIDDKKEEYSVLIREVQRDPLSGSYLHADFYQLPMNEEVTVTVPLEFEGIAPAVKEFNGVFIRNIQELEIKALPKNLIHSIKVDTSSLVTLDDEIKIKDLDIPSAIQVLADPEEIVALVGKAEEEKVEEVTEEEEKEKIEEIEVVGKQKEEEVTDETEKEKENKPKE